MFRLSVLFHECSLPLPNATTLAQQRTPRLRHRLIPEASRRRGLSTRSGKRPRVLTIGASLAYLPASEQRGVRAPRGVERKAWICF